MKSVSNDLKEILEKKSSEETLYLSDFTNHFGSRSATFIIALLALPIALPFTPPGINTPFAIACILLCFSYILNQKNYKLPGFIENRKVPFKPDGGFFKAMSKLLIWSEVVIKPRWGKIIDFKFSNVFLGLGMMSAAIVMIIPLPIINSVSSFIVLMVALGIVAKDGLIATLFSLSGYLLLILSIGLIVYGFIIGESFFTNY